MCFVHIVTFRNANSDARISPQDFTTIKSIVMKTPGLAYAKLHTPESAQDYYTDDGHSPQLVIESYFNDLSTLENNLTATGHLQILAEPNQCPTLLGTQVEHQVMISRPYPVPDSQLNLPAGEQPCSYLVHYPGHAKDFFTWLNYYLAHHPQIMQRFPSIRGIEIYTRVDWIDEMPWPRANYMQRNKLVFDSPEHLTAALNSQVRHDMRADYEKFPPFAGENRHFAMSTLCLGHE